MKKSRALMLVVGALVFGLALGSVGIAYAQTDDEAAPKGGFIEVITDLLGLTSDELRDAKQDGQSLPRIAEDAGVSTDDMVDALVAAQIERLDALLADDLITQEQYDWAVANAAEKTEERILSDGLRPHRRGPGGPGMRGDGETGMRGQFGEAGCFAEPETLPET